MPTNTIMQYQCVLFGLKTRTT